MFKGRGELKEDMNGDENKSDYAQIGRKKKQRNAWTCRALIKVKGNVILESSQYTVEI